MLFHSHIRVHRSCGVLGHEAVCCKGTDTETNEVRSESLSLCVFSLFLRFHLVFGLGSYHPGSGLESVVLRFVSVDRASL